MENQYRLEKLNNKIKILDQFKVIQDNNHINNQIISHLNLNLEIIQNKYHINKQIKDNQYLQMIEINNNKLELHHHLQDILIENKLVQWNKHNIK